MRSWSDAARLFFCASSPEPSTFFSTLLAPKKYAACFRMALRTSEAEDLVDTVDRERIAYVKHYFDADWPTRSLYHLMINTAVGNESVIETILHTMRLDRGPSQGHGLRTSESFER